MGDEILREWGHNIRLHREVLNADALPRDEVEEPMSQWQLGQLLDPPVNQSTVNRWERGLMEPKKEYKAQLAGVLHSDVRLIFPLTRVIPGKRSTPVAL